MFTCGCLHVFTIRSGDEIPWEIGDWAKTDAFHWWFTWQHVDYAAKISSTCFWVDLVEWGIRILSCFDLFVMEVISSHRPRPWYIRVISQTWDEPVQDTMIYSCFHCDRMATWHHKWTRRRCRRWPWVKSEPPVFFRFANWMCVPFLRGGSGNPHLYHKAIFHSC